MESTPISETAAGKVAAPRMLSLDALRGFDMFWIIGGGAFLEAVAARWPSPWMQALQAQFTEHVEWDGFRFHDGIFPLFLFIIGATLPWSIGRRVENGTPRASIVGKVLVRFLWLVVFGLVINGLTRLEGWSELRLFGVLQRQAFGYLAVALLYLFAPRRWWPWLWAGILLAYGAMLAFVPVPGHGVGLYTPEGNLANHVDRVVLLPGQMYKEYGDPEGPLSNLPSIATALMGLMAGDYLHRGGGSPSRKSMVLAAAGIACFAAGCALHPVVPVIKKIWTSSFVLVSGGVSLVLLAAFHEVLDVRKWTRGSAVWAAIGANAITAYMGVHIVDFDGISEKFVVGLMRLYPAEKDLLLRGGALLIVLLALHGMRRKGIFLRV
ncbi:MAG: acyltransferase family protein [Armatimonadota bacterium]